MLTGYDSATVWLVIALTGVLTFAIHGSFIYLFGHTDDVPPAVESVLRYIPAAVFAALAPPTLLIPPDDLAVSVSSDKFVVGALAALAVRYTKRILATTLVGMGALWALRFAV